MGLSCGAKMAKCLLFIFNVCFFIFGGVILGCSIWIVVDKQHMLTLVSQALGDKNVVTNHLSTNSTMGIGAFILIGVGSFNFLVGFLGCCGAITENKCFLHIYAFLIGLVVLLELVGVILAAVFKTQVESALQKGLAKSLNNSYIGLPGSTKAEHPISLAWDFVMIMSKCCGLNGDSDFTKNPTAKASYWYTNGKTQTVNGKSEMQMIPYACCKYKSLTFVEKKWADFYTSRTDTQCGPKVQSYNKMGCYEKLKNKAVKYAHVIIGVAVSILLIEILGIVLACCLIRSIGDSRDVAKQ